MSTIVGHGLAGAAIASTLTSNVAKERRPTVLVFAGLLGLAPDLDVLVYMAFRPLGMAPHRGITHTLVFAALTSAIVAFGLRRFFGFTYLRAFCMCFGVWFSHLFLDFLMGAGPPVLFFWPFSDEGCLLPFRAVPTAFYGLSADTLLAALVSPATILGVLLEYVIFTPLVLFPRCNDAASRVRLTVISATGLLLTIMVYNG